MPNSGELVRLVVELMTSLSRSGVELGAPPPLPLCPYITYHLTYILYYNLNTFSAPTETETRSDNYELHKQD